ncbi:hypothetical protein F4692_001463 [Nocardioides cavernae]|uniref:Uncharacterized protein n=1 Tax=Nocardioides cavernae TaxID=1921566 RepID=A0A7Y9KR98_9ACTN|nr:hypothetical protein [Nocardioides cavernae]NYE36359.1 hypothetical protein [Nocardioides cavernae]
MTDPSDLTPEQEAVRRLLADARHDGPPPPEVVSRLNETLAALVAERAESGDAGSAPVVDLGARRRRLTGMGVLAAAAVVVAGVALGQALPRGANDSADSGGASQAESAPSPEASDDAGAGIEDPSAMSSELTPEAKRGLTDAPELAPADDDTLDAQLLRLRAAARPRSQDSAEASILGDCLMPGLGPGRRAYATLDDVPVVVVYGRPSGDEQRVAVYACGAGDEPLRETVLPAP